MLCAIALSYGHTENHSYASSTPFPINARLIRVPSVELAKTSMTQLLARYIPLLQLAEVSLVQTKVLHSVAASHTHFQCMIHGVPIYGAVVVVSQYSGQLLIQHSIPSTDVPTAPAVVRPEMVFFWDEHSGLQPATLESTDNKATGECEDRIFSPSGELLWLRNRNAYFTDTTIGVRVFRPDPLSSGSYTYGGTYIDNNDANAPWLDGQLISQVIPARFANGQFYLEDQYINMSDWGTPTVPSPTLTTPQFYFTRSDEAFEYVNAFYHLGQYRRYVHDLGFGCADNYVEVDAHYGTGDQSFFSAASPPRLQFGDGGVDDAEDADVLIHEYGHCLSFYANNSSNFGGERNAIDEAFCDYLAASYSLRFTSFKSEWVFNWDGHNAFWNGRIMNSTKKSPADKNGNIYNDAQILSSALWGSLQEIGMGTMDSIAIEGIYAMGPNLTLEQAAEIFIQADSALFDGENFCVLYRNMYARGLMPFIPGNSCGVQNSIAEGDDQQDAIRMINHPSAFTLLFPESIRNAVIDIYNLTGQLMTSMPQDGQAQLSSPMPLLAEGMYCIVVRHDFGQENFRWVKSR